LITLTTDFGEQDGFVGAMKGVIWGICPEAQIADISHQIAPQNVLEGALVLRRACPHFPDGTVHLAVVDPGVGTQRRPLAGRIGTHFVVGPDNGLFSFLVEEAEARGLPAEFVTLENPRYWRAEVSRTFHGRDIFAPVAAHLARGVSLADLGPALVPPVRIRLPEPVRTTRGWQAHVIAIDHFGNLASDLPAGKLPGYNRVVIHVGGREIAGVNRTYGEQSPGALVALADSENRLEIAVVNGSAARELGAQVGDLIEVETLDP
jgi:S-adenosylmethionine hydrolase